MFPASVDRWPHVVAFCSDSLSLVCWLVEHPCAAPLPSTQAHTHTVRYTSTQAYTNTHTLNTRMLVVKHRSQIRFRYSQRPDKLGALGILGEGGTTPTTAAPSNHGTGKAESAGRKRTNPTGGCRDVAGGFESRKFQGLTVSLTLNRLSDQTYVFVFNRGVYQSDSRGRKVVLNFFFFYSR